MRRVDKGCGKTERVLFAQRAEIDRSERSISTALSPLSVELVALQSRGHHHHYGNIVDRAGYCRELREDL